jgi:hypothetical protein
MDHFELQPEKEKLADLAQEYWLKQGETYQQLERDAFEAGSRIRNRDTSVSNLDNLRRIVYWKSPRVVPHLEKNSAEEIETALSKAASLEASTKSAIEALTKLRGVGIPVASAILTAIHPERFTIIDFRALEALGYLRQDVSFYERYLDFCKDLAASGIIEPQAGLPAPTMLRALDRALWQWSENQSKDPGR